MPALIEQFTANFMSLDLTYSVAISPARLARLEKFYADTQAQLAAIDFDALSQEDKSILYLLKNHVTARQHWLALKTRQVDEMQPLLPFAETIESLLEKKRLMQRPDAEQDAAVLSEMVKDRPKARATCRCRPKNEVDPAVANRAAFATEQLSSDLHDWFDQYTGYDPTFTWWVDLPYKAAQDALKDYSIFLRKKLVDIPPGDKTTIIGDPVGREALLNELADNMIPYSPEELIAIAQTEYDWSMSEMLKASREMGFGDNWHGAVEKVKQMHVPPGEQPELIRKLVVEGIDFAKNNRLVTVPPLAEETWRMIMMTPERSW